MSRAARIRQRGVSLVEVIVFMVIVGVAAASTLMVFSRTTETSADPLLRKRALAIAESLLEEMRLMPFTFCDPDDPLVYTVASGAGCGTAEAMNPEPGETRYSTTSPYDNVNDYNGFDTSTAVPAGICDIIGNCIAALAGYTATVAVVPAVFNGIPNTDALLITVTVTMPNGQTLSLDGVRTRYAPNL